MKKFISHCPQETESCAFKLAGLLKPGDVIALRGDLGAGKTAFVRGLADGMSVYGEVSSPTYSIVNEYSGRVSLYHFDMYRITDMDELYTTGFFDYLESGGVCAVEWSENIEWALPENTIYVSINKLSESGREDEREIVIDGANGDERF